MVEKYKFYNLTKRELEIMEILWKADTPLIAIDIAGANEVLKINTVRTILPKLLDKKLIKVAELKIIGTALTRFYEPAITRNNFILQRTAESFMGFIRTANKDISTSHLVVTLLNQEKNGEKELAELVELEKIILERRKKLEN